MSAIDPTSSADVFQYRLALREESSCQGRLLSQIAASGCAEAIVLCGSAALHGIHLHGRRTPVVDFMASHDAAARLAGDLTDAGVAIQMGPASSEYAVSGSSAVFPDLRLAIRVFARAGLPADMRRADFADAMGRRAPLAVLSFGQLAMRKLACLAQRRRCTDYLDFWLILRDRPDAADAIRAAMVDHASSKSSHVPRRPMTPEDIVARLEWLRPRWTTELDGIVYPVPDVDTVASELTDWLCAWTRGQRLSLC